MRCEEVREQTLDYLVEHTSKPLIAAVRQHLDSCEACRAALVPMQQLWEEMEFIPAGQLSQASLDRFETMLNSYQEGQMDTVNQTLLRSESHSRTQRFLLVGLLLLVGVAVAHRFSFYSTPSKEDLLSANAPIIYGTAPDIRGKVAPDFELSDLNGRTVRMADLRGKVVLVNFWATWCAPCVTEMPWFSEFQAMYGPQGFQVVAIALDENTDLCGPFVEQHKVENLTVLLGDQSTAQSFGGILGLPTTFLVDRDGKFFSKHAGLVNRDTIEAEIVTLLRD
jgi:thiol-disulfide isomerase/thioredoxin